MQQPLSSQSMESSNGERQHSAGYSILKTGKDNFNLRAYRFAICDENLMLEIEKEFVQHCSNHYSNDTQKDAVLERFETFILRHFGCEMCSEMFEIEEEFVQHCYKHYCDKPEKETFLGLFENTQSFFWKREK